MAQDLEEHGVMFIKGGKMSQSLVLSNLFDVKDGAVMPWLKAADPLVRTNVLFLDPEFAVVISKAVKEVFLPYFDQLQRMPTAILSGFVLALTSVLLDVTRMKTTEEGKNEHHH